MRRASNAHGGDVVNGDDATVWILCRARDGKRVLGFGMKSLPESMGRIQPTATASSQAVELNSGYNNVVGQIH